MTGTLRRLSAGGRPSEPHALTACPGCRVVIVRRQVTLNGGAWHRLVPRRAPAWRCAGCLDPGGRGLTDWPGWARLKLTRATEIGNVECDLPLCPECSAEVRVREAPPEKISDDKSSPTDS